MNGWNRNDSGCKATIFQANETLITLLEDQRNYQTATEVSSSCAMTPLHEATYRRLMHLQALVATKPLPTHLSLLYCPTRKELGVARQDNS